MRRINNCQGIYQSDIFLPTQLMIEESLRRMNKGRNSISVTQKVTNEVHHLQPDPFEPFNYQFVESPLRTGQITQLSLFTKMNRCSRGALATG